MICKCPNCSGALTYDPSIEKMTCPYCGEVFQVADIAAEVQEDAETMTCEIYGCTSCGAEIMVNDTEVSTFCAYCGQPTIVFNRVSRERKPDAIIPFKITKDEAISKIREKLEKGKFVPKEIKNFEEEKIRGIYVPYRAYDIYHYDKQKLSAYIESAKRKKEFIREAECNFHGIACDVSAQLNDEITLRLEPYDLKELKPFDIGYLSGFYADKYDVEEGKAREVALKRAKDFFDGQITEGIRSDSIKVLESSPKQEIIKSDYVLLPAWFMIFRYEDEAYTILVNGQTGETIGAVPVEKKKVWIQFAITAAIAIPICILLITYLVYAGAVQFTYLGAPILWIILYAIGASGFRSLSQGLKLTKDKQTEQFVRERRDEN